MSTQIQNRQQQPQAVSQSDTLCSLILKQKAQIALAIGGRSPEERNRNADRFARICMTAVRQTPKLGSCTTESFLSSLMTCAQLGLEPNTPQGLAYLIPYENYRKHVTEAQFQIGYKGLLQLAYKSGMVASINADVVYRAELEAGMFSYSKGIQPTITHQVELLHPEYRSGEIVAAYAACTLTTGQTLLRVVDAKDIERAKASSKSARSEYSPWNTHAEAMWIKTAIKRLAAWMPQTEMLAVAIDEDSRTDAIEPDGSDGAGGLAQSGGIAAMNAAFAAAQQTQTEVPRADPQHAIQQQAAPQQPTPEPRPQQPQEQPQTQQAASQQPRQNTQQQDFTGDAIQCPIKHVVVDTFSCSFCGDRPQCPEWQATI